MTTKLEIWSRDSRGVETRLNELRADNAELSASPPADRGAVLARLETRCQRMISGWRKVFPDDRVFIKRRRA